MWKTKEDKHESVNTRVKHVFNVLLVYILRMINQE